MDTFHHNSTSSSANILRTSNSSSYTNIPTEKQPHCLKKSPDCKSSSSIKRSQLNPHPNSHRYPHIHPHPHLPTKSSINGSLSFDQVRRNECDTSTASVHVVRKAARIKSELGNEASHTNTDSPTEPHGPQTILMEKSSIINYINQEFEGRTKAQGELFLEVNLDALRNIFKVPTQTSTSTSTSTSPPSASSVAFTQNKVRKPQGNNQSISKSINEQSRNNHLIGRTTSLSTSYSPPLSSVPSALSTPSKSSATVDLTQDEPDFSQNVKKSPLHHHIDPKVTGIATQQEGAGNKETDVFDLTLSDFEDEGDIIIDDSTYLRNDGNKDELDRLIGNKENVEMKTSCIVKLKETKNSKPIEDVIQKEEKDNRGSDMDVNDSSDDAFSNTSLTTSSLGYNDDNDLAIGKNNDNSKDKDNDVPKVASIPSTYEKSSASSISISEAKIKRVRNELNRLQDSNKRGLDCNFYNKITKRLKPWACSACTFLNNNNPIICEMCKSEKVEEQKLGRTDFFCFEVPWSYFAYSDAEHQENRNKLPFHIKKPPTQYEKNPISKAVRRIVMKDFDCMNDKSYSKRALEDIEEVITNTYFKAKLGLKFLQRHYDILNELVPNGFQLRKDNSHASSVIAFYNREDGICDTHYDQDPSVLYLIKGSKEVWLAPYSFIHQSRYIPSCLNTNRTILDNIKPFESDVPLSDCWKKIVLKPGDCLYLPKRCIHAVKSKKNTLALSFQTMGEIEPRMIDFEEPSKRLFDEWDMIKNIEINQQIPRSANKRPKSYPEKMESVITTEECRSKEMNTVKKMKMNEPPRSTFTIPKKKRKLESERNAKECRYFDEAKDEENHEKMESEITTEECRSKEMYTVKKMKTNKAPTSTFRIPKKKKTKSERNAEECRLFNEAKDDKNHKKMESDISAEGYRSNPNPKKIHMNKPPRSGIKIPKKRKLKSEINAEECRHFYQKKEEENRHITVKKNEDFHSVTVKKDEDYNFVFPNFRQSRRKKRECGIVGCKNGFIINGLTTEMYLLTRNNNNKDLPLVPVGVPKHLICKDCQPVPKKEFQPSDEYKKDKNGVSIPFLTLEELPEVNNYSYYPASLGDYKKYAEMGGNGSIHKNDFHSSHDQQGNIKFDCS